jgi:hypothetical protein
VGPPETKNDHSKFGVGSGACTLFANRQHSIIPDADV